MDNIPLDIPPDLLVTDYIYDPFGRLILSPQHASGQPCALVNIDRWNSLANCLQLIGESGIQVEVRGQRTSTTLSSRSGPLTTHDRGRGSNAVLGQTFWIPSWGWSRVGHMSKQASSACT